MCKRSYWFCLCAVVLALFCYYPATATVHQYVEDFSTKQYCDTLNTTAWWDTVAGEIKLFPYELALVGNEDTPGCAQKVVLAGDYAYVADQSSGLQVIDISDPTDPTLVGYSTTPDIAVSIAISGDYAYVGTWGSGLQVIDISDPTNPIPVGAVCPGVVALGVSIFGDHAFVGCNLSGLTVIDISDPTDPGVVANLDTPGFAQGMAISGDYVYLADGPSGLHVININDPTAPEIEVSVDTPGEAKDIALAGDIAYVADWHSGLQVVDVSVPTAPIIIASIDTPDYAYGVALAGDFAYIVDHLSGLLVIDISSPTGLDVVGSFDTSGHAVGVGLAGEFAYVADCDAGLQVIRIADSVSPVLAGNVTTPAAACGFALSGNYAYVTVYTSGLQVIDISDPVNPLLAGSIDTPSHAHHVSISGDYAFVADAPGGLRVIDISNPTSPAEVGSVVPDGSTINLDLAGDYAYLASGFGGLQVIDIRTPASPTVVGSAATSDAADVDVIGDYALVGNRDGTVQSFNISDPTSPILAGSVATPGWVYNIAVSGNYAYVADMDGGLRVLDISDPAAPYEVGSLGMPNYVYDVAIAGDKAYVATYYSGLMVVDISVPTAPVLIEGIDLPVAYNVVVDGDYAFVSDGEFPGLHAIRVFQRRFDIQSNIAQSLVIDDSNHSISQARLTTSQVGSVLWELSLDNGANWDILLPGDEWHVFTSPGSDLLWRSTHVYVGGHVNPSCYDLMIEWTGPEPGSIEGFVLADCPAPDTGLLGVEVDAFGVGTGDLVSTVTNADGFYEIQDLEAGEYIVSVVTPLGYMADSEEVPITVSGGEVANADFTLSCVEIVSNPRSIGFWKHQVGVASGGHGNAQVDPTTLCQYLDAIESHFNDNMINPVAVYVPPVGADCAMKLEAAKELINLKGNVGNLARAKQHLLALLFNVAAGYLGAIDIISTDGATASQAITYCDNLIDDWENGDHDLARDIADMINNGMTVPAGFIPLTTIQIAYNQGLSSRGMLLENSPNPFNPATTISYMLEQDTVVTLRIYDVSGRLVRTLMDGTPHTQGRHETVWDGCDEIGRHSSAGAYLCRIDAANRVDTRLMMLVK